jgi:PAS domain S-box-containing protein
LDSGSTPLSSTKSRHPSPAFIFTFNPFCFFFFFGVVYFYNFNSTTFMEKKGTIPGVLHFSDHVVYICVDALGLITECNAKAKHLFPFIIENETSFISILPELKKKEWSALLESFTENNIDKAELEVQWLKLKEDFSITFELLPERTADDLLHHVQMIGCFTDVRVDVLQSLPEQNFKAPDDKYKLLFYHNPLPLWIYDATTLRFLEVNEAATNNYGFSREEFLAMTIDDIRPTTEQIRLQSFHTENGFFNNVHHGYWIHRRKDGSFLQVEITAHLIAYEGRPAKLVMANDRSEHIAAEEEIIKTNERYSFVSKATFDAIWDWDIENDTTQWNHVVSEIFGYSDNDVKDNDWWNNNLHPDDKERVTSRIDKHIKDRQHHWEEEYRLRCADGTYKYILDRGFTIYDEDQRPVRMIGAMQDLTDRKKTELTLKELNASLEKRARELAESNAELERFAYVASHDLQEPLRMVSSFLQLIEKRYKNKLDQKAHEYIAFAVDGAERMKGLILDLLEYSRVNTSKEEREEVDVNTILNDLKHVYKNVLNDTRGSINATHLPAVQGSRTQIMQLFQNLIGNALKYRSEKAPLIDISWKHSGDFVEFAITDNGIGIDPRFFPKIFIIFQRLHNREQYSGTGIGLAICKKIVERHGGNIWVSSEPTKGSTFYFTLPT